MTNKLKDGKTKLKYFLIVFDSLPQTEYSRKKDLESNSRHCLSDEKLRSKGMEFPGGGFIAQSIAYLVPTQRPWVQAPAFPKLFKRKF